MSEQSARVFPIIHTFKGHPSEDGSFFLLQGTGFDQSPLHFAIPLDNIQHFIAFLLMGVGAIRADHNDNGDAKSGSNSLVPIPATSIAIGHPNGNKAYVAISVGRVNLVFSLPASALTSVGHSLMLAGTPSNAVPS